MGNLFSIRMPQRSGKGRAPTRKSLMVGAYVPQEQAERISLFSLYREVSKSEIICEALQKIRIPNEQEMVMSLSKRALLEWGSRIKANARAKGWQSGSEEAKRLEEFCQEATMALNKRGVGRIHINQIIENIRKWGEGL